MITRADSEYSIGSFKKHGFLIGWMMTTDRLFRCGRDEVRLSPQVISGNRQGVPLGNHDAALTSLNNLTTIAPNQEVADEAHYQKGWVYLEMGLRASACYYPWRRPPVLWKKTRRPGGGGILKTSH